VFPRPEYNRVEHIPTPLRKGNTEASCTVCCSNHACTGQL